MSRSLNRTDVTIAILNLVCVVIYLYISSLTWRDFKEMPITAEPFIWAFALPALGFSFLLDIGWLAVILRRKKRQGWEGLLSVAVLWVITLIFDFSRH